MIQDVFIVGATGNVGKELVRQIYVEKDTDPVRHENPTRVVGLASSAHVLYFPEGIPQEQAQRFASRNYNEAQGYSELRRLLEIAERGLRSQKSTLVFVDVTALRDEMTAFHLLVIEQTPYGIVTANKNPIALSDYNTFQRLTHDARRYGYRCSVMAGAEAVPYVRDARDINEVIRSAEGCLSGTNGYITSQLEAGERSLSQIVRDAYAQKYTEPHPRDDLNGLDVARKLVVIARSAGLSLGMKDARVVPLVPEKYLLENDVARFLDSLPELDPAFKDRMDSAKLNGATLRYVAKLTNGETPSLEVSLQEVPKNSPLGRLEGTDNMIIIKTSVYPRGHPIGPVPGAGVDVTAANIRKDLLHLLPERKNGINLPTT